MLLSDTLWDMNSRQIAGSIVRDELARQGYKQDKAAERAHIAKSTLSRVLAGDPTVQEMTLRQVEGLLNMPRRFLTYVINADVERLSALTEMDPDLRRHALDSLSDLGDTVQNDTKRQEA